MPGPGMEWIGEEEIQEVVDVLRGGYIYRYGVSTGPDADRGFKGKVSQCEQEIANYAGVRYAVAVNSGTSALLAALVGLGVGPGDEVIVPGFTYIASISSVVYCKAIPVLAEIDETFNLDPEDLKRKITRQTKAIMPVHMMGNPARLDEIKQIADEHGIPVLEDSAQAFGATYKGRSVGSVGKVGTFSFNVYKTITSGDGGMVITDDEEVYRRAFAFHDQGHLPLRTGVEIGQRPFFGLDFRYTELQAAVLMAQFHKLPRILERLRENKKRYKELISDLPGLRFREITDAQGECATMLTLILPSAEIAQTLAAELGTKVVARAGWHVYNNMEQLLQLRLPTAVPCPFSCFPIYAHENREIRYWQGMLPKTDALLERALNISIGVSDKGLSSGFGVTLRDDLESVERHAAGFRKVAGKYLK
jgi:dTDP-4-amino-4,6-dideoxygalactose transaminase